MSTPPLESESPAEGAVDWNAAQDFVTGGKGATEDGAAGETEVTETPDVKEFKYRGKAVKVDATTYDLLEELRKEARGSNGRLGSENQQLKERLARLEGMVTATQKPAPTEPELKRPDPALATRDFAEWERQYEAYRDAKEERRLRELYNGYQQDKEKAREDAEKQARATEWAAGFYEKFDYLDNPDLKKIVAEEYVAHEAAIKAEDDIEDQYERLAELADARIVRLRAAGKTTKTNRAPRLETSAGPTPGRKATEESVADDSMGSWVAKERARMRGESLK